MSASSPKASPDLSVRTASSLFFPLMNTCSVRWSRREIEGSDGSEHDSHDGDDEEDDDGKK